MKHWHDLYTCGSATLVLLLVFSFSQLSTVWGVTVSDNESDFVKIEDGHFWLRGKRLYLHGVNYWPRYTLSLYNPHIPETWNCYQWWLSCDYRPSDIEEDFKRIRELGMNLIVVSGPYEGDYRASALQNLKELLKIARKYGIFVILHQSFPITLSPEEAVSKYKNRIRFLNLAHDPTLIGYDIAWEIRLGSKVERQHLNDEWTTWVLTKYGNLSAAESYWAYSPRILSHNPLIISDPEDEQLVSEGQWSRFVTDYWRFAYDWANAYFRPIVQAIKEVDPNHLVTIRNGFGGSGSVWANKYAPPDVSMGADFFDFLSPEAWLARTVFETYEWQIAGIYCKEEPAETCGPEPKRFDNPTDNNFDFMIIPPTLDLVDPSRWPQPAPFTPRPNTVSGRVFRGDNGQPLANVRIERCSGPDVYTDANGYFQFAVTKGEGYCVRVRLDDSSRVFAINPSPALLEEARKTILADIGFTTSYAKWATREKKPVVWIEFGQSVGIFPIPQTLELQKRLYQYIYEAALEYDVDGVVAWWYPGGPRLDEKSDFGIVNSDNSFRPVAEPIKWYASHVTEYVRRPIDAFVYVSHGTQDPLGYAGIRMRSLPHFQKLLLDGKRPGVRFLLDLPVTPMSIGVPSFSKEKALLFLESQYIQEAGLLKAAVTAEPDKHRIYVASDNLLAARALILLGSEMGKGILEKLATHYGYGFNAKHEVVVGFDIPDEFYVQSDEKLGEVHSRTFNTTFEILYERPDRSRVLTDWHEYADLLTYRALDLILAERVNEAKELLGLLLSLWDGYGFSDRVHMADESKRYETYKVALALFLCRVLEDIGQDCGATDELLDMWQSILSGTQRADGGVVAHYIVKGQAIEPRGDANTETTSIAALALSKLPSLFRPESKLYLIQIDVTTDSDWTVVSFLSGPRVIDYNGSIFTGGDAPELKYNFDGSHVWISKKQYNMKTVALRIVGVAVKGSELGRVVITKGHIGSTEVTLSLWNGEQFTRFISLRHEGVNWTEPGANPRFFTVHYANLYARPSATALYEPVPLAVQKKICAFYYPWYGNLWGPSGKWFHWSGVGIDSIASSTNYPLLGPYDSYDERVIETHMLLAKASGIDCFIASWWGPLTFEDMVLGRLLSVGERVGFNVTLYYESYREQRPLVRHEDVVNELSYVVKRYADSSAFLKADGKPVLFIYAVEAHGRGPSFWLKVRQDLENLVGDVYIIGDLRDRRYLSVFDGFHTYNELNLDVMKELFDMYRQKMSLGLAGMELDQAINLMMVKGTPIIQEKTLSFTVVPGYDDRKIRSPGLYLDRKGGETYKSYWNAALKADPDLVLVTSWNEWHEGTEIEPSREHDFSYLQFTARYAAKFKGRTAPPVEKPSLRAEYMLSSDGKTLVLKLTTGGTAFIVKPEIPLQSSLHAIHIDNYLTFTTKRDGLDVMGIIFPLLKPRETLELSLRLGGLLPETMTIPGGHITYYSIDGEKLVLEMTQKRFNKLTIRSPESSPIAVDGVVYFAKGGNVSLWIGEKPVELSVLKDIIQIADDERLAFHRWSDGVREPRRILKLEGPTILEIIYQRQFKLSIAGGYSLIIEPTSESGDEWYAEGTNVSISTKAIWYLDDLTRKVLTSYVINNKEHMIFKPEEEFTLNFVMERPIQLEFRYVTEHLVKAYSQFGSISGDGWYPEGSEATLTVDTETMPMEGVLGLIGATYQVDSKVKNVIVIGPLEVYYTWTPNYTRTLIMVIVVIVSLFSVVSTRLLVRGRKSDT